MKFLQKLRVQTDLATAQVLERQFASAVKNKTLMQDAPEIIPKMNKIYALYAKELKGELHSSNMDIDKTVYALTIFTMATIVSAMFYQKMGVLEAQKEIIDYYYGMFEGSKVRVSVMENAILEELKYDALLKTTILDIESNKNTEQVKSNLESVEDYLFRQMNNKKAPKSIIGQMALFQFVSNRQERAEEYLKMYYEYTGNKVDSIVQTEVEANNYIESELIKNYTGFVQKFLDTKNISKTMKMN